MGTIAGRVRGTMTQVVENEVETPRSDSTTDTGILGAKQLRSLGGSSEAPLKQGVIKTIAGVLTHGLEHGLVSEQEPEQSPESSTQKIPELLIETKGVMLQQMLDEGEHDEEGDLRVPDAPQVVQGQVLQQSEKVMVGWDKTLNPKGEDAEVTQEKKEEFSPLSPIVGN